MWSSTTSDFARMSGAEIIRGPSLFNESFNLLRVASFQEMAEFELIKL